MTRKLDFGVFGMTLGGLAGYFAAFYAYPRMGAADWPIFVLTTATTLAVVAGGALGYRLVANPRPYEAR